MSRDLRWDEFAEAVVTRLIRPNPGDSLLIIVDTSNDMALAQACFSAGVRAGADTLLAVKPRYPEGTVSVLGPALSDAIRSSKLIFSLCNGIIRAPATVEARKNGARYLNTVVEGIEDYVIRGLLDVDYEAMIRNGELVAKLWDETRVCRVTSPQGTDVSFELAPRKSTIGRGALTQDGESAFFPGVQVSIAPVEETINGVIVVDASDGVQGIVQSPYSFIMKEGVITAVEGGREADSMRKWLETRNDPIIYKLCHFSIGLNPQARISGNLIEDERVLGAVDFGFGYQDPKFGGKVGSSPYHQDVMLATPAIHLDGKQMSGGGKLNEELGFEKM